MEPTTDPTIIPVVCVSKTALVCVVPVVPGVEEANAGESTVELELGSTDSLKVYLKQ